MNIEQFKILLNDMYKMDLCMPPIALKWKNTFIQKSYSKWALEELERYIIDRLYPRQWASIDEYTDIINDFIQKMDYYCWLNESNGKIFSIAKTMALDVLDLFYAMQ